MISSLRYRSAAVRRISQVVGLVLFTPWLLTAQAGDPPRATLAEVIQNLRAHFNRIEDYQVDLQVSLDMPVLRMPRKKMTFYFKQPDKIQLKAVGFAIVPRRGLALSPDSLFQNLGDLAIAGDTLLDGNSCYLLRGNEAGPADQIFLVELIVDRELWVVRGITTYMENHEIFNLQTEYIEVAPGIHMPQETHLRFQLNEQFIRGQSRDPGSYDPDTQELVFDDLEDMAGEASIVFSNYRVNLGIPDEFFSEEER